MGGIDFTSTHPANSKRIKQLDHWMHEVSCTARVRLLLSILTRAFKTGFGHPGGIRLWRHC